jgi:hypothetical protein
VCWRISVASRRPGGGPGERMTATGGAPAAPAGGGMAPPAPIVIDAVVADTERPAIIAACEQLHECLRVAAGRAWPIELRFRPAAAAIVTAPLPTLAIVSLLPDLARGDEPPAERAARWRAALTPLICVVPAVFVCTIFRHVAAGGAPEAPADGIRLVERIRRLNLFAAELSHDTGAGVLDLDRVLAHIGARELQSDYRLTSRIAAEVAGHAIVAGLLAVGLDDIVPPDVQQRAQQYQGNLWGIYAYVDRRLRQRPPGA